MIIRWVSEDGKRKWIYPVERDIYTRGKILKQVSHKAKIIGATKVNIPSPFHPIVPYYVMLLEDEYGNRLPKKTMKERKIGEIFEIKKASTDGAVIITKIKYDISEYLKESMGLLNSYEINKDDKFLVMPTIIDPSYTYQAVNTNPCVLDAVIGYLKERGADDIMVAGQAMLGNDTIESAKKAGIIDICKKHGIEFVDLSKSEFIEKKTDGFAFMIARDVFERKIINVPVMKTHSQIGVSGAMENMVRAADEETQKRMHNEDIEKTLPKLIRTLPPFLSVGDATIGMQSQGPMLGEPAFLNMIFISKDPVALDSVFAESGMLEIPYYLNEAAALNVGIKDTEAIEIVGDELEAVKFQIKPAEQNVSAHPHIELIDGKANPYLFNSSLKLTSNLVGLLGYRTQLVIGNILTEDMLKGKERLVAYGDEAIQKVKQFGFNAIAEISEDADDAEKLMLLKRVLEDPKKSKITIKDRIISKLANFRGKIKKTR